MTAAPADHAGQATGSLPAALPVAIAPTPASLIPADIGACLSAEQHGRLIALLAERRSEHALDYRVSTSFFGRRFYICLFGGSELRSLRRLQAEGLERPFWGFLFDVLIVTLAILLVLGTLLGAGVGLVMLFRSVFGIDLVDGPSFWDRLYH
jgi:hypothetical protein